MDSGELDALIRVLQASISPVAMVSGVGLLLLSLTNRFARVTDRIRELASEREHGTTARVEKQIEIFVKRAKILRSAIAAAVGCMLLASCMVLLLFAIAVARAPAHLVVLLLFALSIISLIVALLLFLFDMRLSLRAVHEELRK